MENKIFFALRIVLARLLVLVAGQNVQEVIDDAHGVVAVPRKVEDALGVLHADLVAVGVVDHLGLLLQSVG